MSRSTSRSRVGLRVRLDSARSRFRMGFDAYVDRMEMRPPIAVRDELESGMLVEADTLPGITETFYAVTLKRRFPNPVVRSLISDAKGDVIKI